MKLEMKQELHTFRLTPDVDDAEISVTISIPLWQHSSAADKLATMWDCILQTFQKEKESWASIKNEKTEVAK